MTVWGETRGNGKGNVLLHTFLFGTSNERRKEGKKEGRRKKEPIASCVDDDGRKHKRARVKTSQQPKHSCRGSKEERREKKKRCLVGGGEGKREETFPKAKTKPKRETKREMRSKVFCEHACVWANALKRQSRMLGRSVFTAQVLAVGLARVANAVLLALVTNLWCFVQRQLGKLK